MRRWIALMALALAAGCGEGPDLKPPRTTPKPVPDRFDLPGDDYGKLDLLAGLEKESLRNGLSVFVKEDRRLPIVSVVTVYRVGSVHEPEGTSGLAHFLEHMLFKGTDKYAKGEIDRLTVRAGGVNNAFTQNDYTLYWFTVAADSLDDVLQIEASRMRNSTLDPKEFDEERNVVLEELWGLLDSPSGQLQYEIDQAVFKVHSYRRPGWGFENDLKNVPHETMRTFYRQHYGPNNASIVVVGDVDPAKTFARARELFGGIERVAEAVPPTGPEPAQTAERRVDIPTDKTLDRIGLAWRTNRAGTPEDYSMDVLQSLLADGKDSRLYKRLVVRDRAAASVEAYNDARRYDGVMYIFAELREKKDPADVEKAILDELEQLKVKPVGGRELQKAKNRITASFIFDKETTLGLAESVGSYEGLGVPDYVRHYLAKVNAVTPESLCAVANAVFRPENRTVAVARAKKQRAAAPRAEPQAAPADFGEVHEHRLSNGLTLLIKPRSGLPIVSIVAYVNAGPLTEVPEKAGVAVLTGRVLDQGFETPDGRTMTGEQIAEALDYTGAQMSTTAEGVQVKALTRDFGRVLDFLRDMMLYPSFPKEKVDLFRGNQITEIEAVGDSPSDLARELWFREVFAGHPLQRPANGLAETVGKLTRADVAAHHKAFYRPDNTIIAVAGHVDPQTVLREVRQRFAEWPTPGPTVVPPLPELRRAEKGKLVVEYRKSKTNQINVCLGHVSLPHTDPDFFAMRVFEQIFCSSPAFTDRLSRIVREEMHLAYSLGGTVTNMDRHPAPFVVHIGSGARNGLEARDRTLKIIDELLRDGPKEEELELAKGYLLRSMPFRWESAESLARYMVTVRRLRLGMDWPLRYRQAIAAVRKDDVLSAARAHISPASISTVVVGPVDKEGKVIEDDHK